MDELQGRFPDFFAVPGTAETPPRYQWFLEKVMEYQRRRRRFLQMYRRKLADWDRSDRPPSPWEAPIYLETFYERERTGTATEAERRDRAEQRARWEQFHRDHPQRGQKPSATGAFLTLKDLQPKPQTERSPT